MRVDVCASASQSNDGVPPALRERIAHETREIQRAEIAAPVRGQRLFAAGIAAPIVSIRQVVVSVDGVDEHDARLGMS